MASCNRCSLVIKEDEFFTCDGGCGKKYHVMCAGPGTGVTKTFHKLFIENEYFIFMCSSCRNFSLKAVNDKLNKVISTIAINDERISRYNDYMKNLQQSLEDMNVKFTKDFLDLRTDVNKEPLSIENKDVKNLLDEVVEIKRVINTNKKEITDNIRKVVNQNQVVKIDTYAQRLKMSSQENVILVKPKIPQESSKTKDDVKSNINPSNFAVNGLHNVSNGGVIIKCPTKHSMNEFKELADKNLGLNYDISIPMPLKPKIKILGFFDNKSPTEIEECLRNQNPFINANQNVHIKVVKIEKNKNSRLESFNIVVEVDGLTYKNIMDQRRVNIHWQRCRVVDCLDLQRCFKCSGFNHRADKCNSKIACPRCAGDHQLKECETTVEKCINCVNINARLSLNLDVNHTVWSKDCKNHQRMLDQKRRRLDLAE